MIRMDKFAGQKKGYEWKTYASSSLHSEAHPVEWLEWLGFGAESCCRASPCDNCKTLIVNLAVNGYLFQTREG